MSSSPSKVDSKKNVANTANVEQKQESGEKPQMKIEIYDDTNLDCRDCYLLIDGDQTSYKENEFAGLIRGFLYDNPEGKVGK
jgi:hypothetical protein